MECGQKNWVDSGIKKDEHKKKRNKYRQDLGGWPLHKVMRYHATHTNVFLRKG
jgi:hypothetical protein